MNDHENILRSVGAVVLKGCRILVADDIRVFRNVRRLRWIRWTARKSLQRPFSISIHVSTLLSYMNHCMNTCNELMGIRFSWNVYIWQEVSKSTGKTTGNVKVGERFVTDSESKE